MPRVKKSPAESNPVSFGAERKNLVTKLLKNSGVQINWPRELLITKKLFESVPDLEFWKQFEAPGFIEKLDSLAIFCGIWGKEFVRKSYNVFLYRRGHKINVVELGEKVGADFIIEPPKNKNLKEFLKN